MLLFPIQWSAQFVPSQMLGVQRLYLDAEGRPRPGPGPDGAPKQMLGAATSRLANSPQPRAGACWLHREAQPGGTVILCEGPETGLGCWDASRLQAIIGILFSAGGLAQVDAALVQGLSPGRVIIAADHDVSGTGERAARRCAWRLHQAGVENIAIALPPITLDGRPIGNAQGSDWLDVLQALGHEAAGRLLEASAVPYAPSAADETLPLAPGSNDRMAPAPAAVISLERLRSSARAPEPPPRLPLSEARTLNARLIRAAVQEARTSVVVAGQTGLGKTHAIRQALADPDTPPALVLTPTTQLAAELVLDYGGTDLIQYLGRSPDPQSSGHCLRFPRIEDLRAGHRSIMAHECQTCPHGLAASRRPDAQEKLLAALNRELYHGRLDLGDPEVRRDLRAEATRVKPCPWLAHRERLPLAPHVAASHAAYHQDRAQVLEKTGPGLPPWRVIFDESPALFEETAVSLKTLTQWLAKNTLDAAHPPEDMTLQAWTELHGRMDAALRALAKRLGEHPDTGNRPLTRADLDLTDLIDTLEVYPRALDGLRPEAVIRSTDGKRLLTPLRALEDLKQALEFGTAWIDHGTLILLVPTRFLRAILAQAPLAVADATPRWLLRQLAGACQPVWTDTPNLSVQLHAGRQHGKRSAQDPRELEDLVQALERHAAGLAPGLVCVLTHKALALKIRDLIGQGRMRGWRPEDIENVGWFGCHDRGQNRWMGCRRLIQWGVHRPAPAIMQRLYEAERAVAVRAGLAWRPWSDERAEQWFPLPYRAADGGGLDIAAKLPVNPDQAAWERDWITAGTVQNIGRLRAAQRPDTPLTVHIYTHYPLEGHGLWLTEAHRPGPRAGGQRARDQWRADLHAGARQRYEQAHAAGRRSRRTINRFLKAQGLPTLGGDKYQELRAKATQDPPAAAVSDDDLDEALERTLEFVLTDPAPVHADEMAALVLDYAHGAEDAADRLAGTLLACALLAPAGRTPAWTPGGGGRDPPAPA